MIEISVNGDCVGCGLVNDKQIVYVHIFFKDDSK